MRRLMAVLLCAVVLLVPTAAGLSAQEAQPTQDPALQVPNDPTAPQPGGNDNASPTEPTAAESQSTPEAVSAQSNQGQTTVSRSAQRADVAAGPGHPAVLAHGLAYVTDDEIVWQVRETDMPSPGSAKSTTSNASVLLQREGSSIIRNDVTGKRAKTDPGEGYFRAAGDGYTVMADGGDSLVWTFELVAPDDVAIDAFYESPAIKDLNEGVYDMMLTRYVLAAGDNVDLPRHSGAALVMVSSGELEVETNGKRSALEQSDGQTITDDAKVSNTSSSDAVFVYVYLGDEVSDNSAGSGQRTSTTPTDESGEAVDSTAAEGTASEGTLQEQAQTGAGSSEDVVPETDEAGNYLTSINVTADAEIYLIITVDGLTVFDGTLPASASSGPVVGTNFEVYTTSGVNTNFTNACGDYFKMGYEEGEVTYTLTATASSCAP